MKKLFLIIAGFFLVSCSSKTEDVAAFQFGGAWYNVINFQEGTTKAELEEYVKTYSNPKTTSYFFFYPENYDVSVFKKEKFNQKDFAATIVDTNPTYGFYRMMPADETIYEDAVWLMEQSIK